MRTKIIALIVFFISLTVPAQTGKNRLLPFTPIISGSKAYFSPERPSVGDTITVRFIPGENSPVKDLDSLYLNTLYLLTEGGSKAEEYLMQRKSKEWSVDFTIENKKVGCIAFQFVSMDFRKVDCNDERGWDILIYDKNGKPVKGANMAYANGYMAHGLIRRVQDMEKYQKGMEAEFKLYPDYPVNLVNTWFIGQRNEGPVKIKRELDSLFRKYPNDVSLLERLFFQYHSMKDTVNEEIVNKRILELDPGNKVAVQSERGGLFFQRADRDKIDALYDLIKKSEGGRGYNTLQIDYFQTLIRAKYYERAFDFLKEWKKPDWIEAIVSPRMMLADCYSVNYSPTKLDLNSKIRFSDNETKFKNIVQIAIDMTYYAIAGYKRMDVSERDVYETPSSWYKERQRFIGLAYGNIGAAKFLVNDFDSAMYYYNTSKKILGNDFYLGGDEAYYTMLIETGKSQYAFEEAKKALELKCGNIELLHQVLRVASETPAMEKEADEIIGKGKSSSAEDRGKEISRNFFTPPRDAIDFTLPDLNGKRINLASMKGKIVILEFWDTYCGWCLKSFEKLQPFYNKHKNDTDIIFLTINTNPSSDEKIKRRTVQEFLFEHKFNFPVLIDNQNIVASAYKLHGVPQTLVIGRDGKVHYRESGYGGPTIAKDLEQVVAKIKQNKE